MYSRRLAAVWIDLILFFSIFMLIDFLLLKIFTLKFFPRVAIMQSYTGPDFLNYWIFATVTLLSVILYYVIAYKFYGFTIGQAISRIRLKPQSSSSLNIKHIFLRSLTVAIKWLVILIPGPLFASLLMSVGVSVFFLFSSIVFLVVESIFKYNIYRSYSWEDKLSKTYISSID